MRRCLLLTQSGHERLRIAAVQTSPWNPFRGAQIPAVIIDAVVVALSLEEGDATTQFHQRNCWISRCLAARRARAAAGAAGDRVYYWLVGRCLRALCGRVRQRPQRN